MTFLRTMRRGIQASVTLDNINQSNDGDSMVGGRGRVPLVGGLSATYERIYRDQIWVHALVNRLSRSVGRLPLKTYIDGGEVGERERVRKGPLADLIRSPFDGGNPFLFKSAIVGNVGIHANAIFVKRRPGPGRPPNELIPSSFAHWTVQAGTERPVDWYIFNSRSGQRVPFRPEEVVHFRWWAPGQGIVAPSPIEALRRTLMIEDAAQRIQIASYENGVRPVGAVSVEGTLNQDVAERLRDQLHETYGGVDNAFKVMLMEGGAKWLEMSHKLVDSEVINTRKLTREEVAAAYNMPPSSIGILDRATFSNIDTQRVMEVVDTLQPWTTMIEETLQTQLIDGEPLMEGQYVEFDYNEILKGDPMKRLQALSKAVGGPWMTQNEARAKENLPPHDDPRADELLVPLNTQPQEEDRDDEDDRRQRE